MTDAHTTKLDRTAIPEILRALEAQLVEMDRIGARIAAAHLDAAILQLRRDLLQSRTNEGDNPKLIHGLDELEALANASEQPVEPGSCAPEA